MSNVPNAVAFETVSDEPSSISAATTSVPELSRLRKRNRMSSIGNESQEEEGGPNTSTTGQFTGAAHEMKNDSSEFKKLLWKKRNLQVHVNEVIFRGTKEMPPAIAALKTPYEYFECFEYFLPEAFMQELADQMNLYAHQINVESRFNTNAHEVRKFIGILFFMSMFLCVDEQMCSTKMCGNPTRQYMPAKPHKWGTKFFVLCDSTGFSYAFEVYSGAGDNVIPENAPDLGASSNVVTRLSAKIPNDVNHILYFDNFYTSLGLLTYLRSRGIYSLRTLRANRVPNIKLSSDAELAKKKVERGYSEEYVANAFGIDISSVLWQDNKTVRLLSTYVGVKPFLSRQIETSNLTSKR